MTNEEAYKFGFLMRCAEEGLSQDQITERIKQASLNKTAGIGSEILGGVKAFGGKGVDLAGRLFGSLLSLGKIGLIAGPPVAGMAGGYVLGKARSDDFDPEEAKQQELIAEYQRALDQFNRSQRVQELA